MSVGVFFIPIANFSRIGISFARNPVHFGTVYPNMKKVRNWDKKSAKSYPNISNFSYWDNLVYITIQKYRFFIPKSNFFDIGITQKKNHRNESVVIAKSIIYRSKTGPRHRNPRFRQQGSEAQAQLTAPYS